MKFPLGVFTCVTGVSGSGKSTLLNVMSTMDRQTRGQVRIGGKDVEIGLICRTGARTSQVANFMAQQGYNVKNLVGGVMKLMGEGYQLSPYKG